MAARQDDPDTQVTSRLRKTGYGRKRLSDTDPQLSEELDRLVAPLTRGDPQSALRWTCKSMSHLAQRTNQADPVCMRSMRLSSVTSVPSAKKPTTLPSSSSSP